jgi:peptidoglycan/LPS O-acetylase OafA/YrhL
MISERNTHIPQLQSLRGLAAMLVLVSHCALYFTLSPERRLQVETILNGHAAIVIFFVLSGYVLSLSLNRVALTVNNISSYVFRRFFRIVPAMWAASLLGLVYILLLKERIPVPDQSQWFLTVFDTRGLTFSRALSSFTGFTHYLDPPLWSISVEMVGSLFLPIAVLAIRRPVFLLPLASALSAVALLHIGPIKFVGLNIYMIQFLVGASISRWQQALGAALSKGAARFAVLLCAAVCLMGRGLGGWGDEALYYHAFVPGILECIAAAVMIALIVEYRNDFGFLAMRGAAFLGDISYSLYLVHFLVMAAVAQIGAGYLTPEMFEACPILPRLVLLTGTICLTLPLAWLSYRYVELPGIAFGKTAMSRIGDAMSVTLSRAQNCSRVSETDHFDAPTH